MRFALIISSMFLLIFSIASHRIHDSFPPDIDQYILRTWTNSTFYGFQGIRYARAPIDELRFKPPVPYEPAWNLTSVHQIPSLTTTPSPACPSPYTPADQPHTDDCLFLNVYTQNITANAPVIVFIHPGGFYILSGTIAHFGPEYLLDHDVVLVTFNYRLSFAGFASSSNPRHQAAGNVGLKDQRLVLRWVAQNIRLFGGNADRVTLMGNSAGAMSVVLQMAATNDEADASRLLFHRAIVMSGGVLPQLRLPENQDGLLARQAALLEECSLRGVDAFECVRAAPPKELAMSVYRMFEYGRDNPIFLWLPVVEKNDDGNAFLQTANPLTAIAANRYAHIPILTGTTSDELIMSAYELLNNTRQTSEWLQDFHRVGPISLHYERGTNRSMRLSDAIWQHYFGVKTNATSIPFGNLSRVFSDAVIGFPVDRLAEVASAVVGRAVYRYEFAFSGDDSMWPHVQHCDDLRYLFTSSLWPRIAMDAGRNAGMVRRMTAMVVAFAESGSPQLFEPDFPHWPQFDAESQQYMRIDDTFRIEKRPFAESCFWNELFPVDDANVAAN